MKKTVLTLFLLTIISGLIACSSEEKLQLGFVVGVSGINDKSYNQNAWEGVKRYAEEFDLPAKNYSYLNAPTADDYTINLARYADQKVDLIIAPGYYFQEPVNRIAEKYPEQKILLIDAVSDGKNVLSASFKTNVGSYLVGIIAALKSEELGANKVGFLGGQEIELLHEFEAGYEAGIKAINPNLELVSIYAGDFTNPSKGKKIAQKMYDEGIKVIYNVAGYTGTGSIEVAKKRALAGKEAWIIGVDKDQYDEGIYQDNKSVILTSMMKNIDILTYETIKDIADNTFTPEIKAFGLEDGIISLPENNPNLKKEWLETIEKYKQDIMDGKIEVPLVPTRLQ